MDGRGGAVGWWRGGRRDFGRSIAIRVVQWLVGDDEYVASRSVGARGFQIAQLRFKVIAIYIRRHATCMDQTIERIKRQYTHVQRHVPGPEGDECIIWSFCFN